MTSAPCTAAPATRWQGEEASAPDRLAVLLARMSLGVAMGAETGNDCTV